MTRDDIKDGTLGLWDGCVSVTGVIFALSRQPPRVIFLAGIGAAISAALSMGTGEYEALEGDPTAVHRGVMLGVSTLIGTMMPVAPFALFGKTAALVVGLVLSYVLAGVVAVLHAKGWVSAFRTYAMFTVVVVLTVLVAVLAPGSA